MVMNKEKETRLYFLSSYALAIVIGFVMCIMITNPPTKVSSAIAIVSFMLMLFVTFWFAMTKYSENLVQLIGKRT